MIIKTIMDENISRTKRSLIKNINHKNKNSKHNYNINKSTILSQEITLKSKLDKQHFS